MPNAIDSQTVAKVARLSRVALSETEVATFAAQLDRILDHVAQLNTLDTTGIEPMYHAVPVTNVLRDDTPAGTLTAAEALANAPLRDDAHFLVPRVLGEGGGA